MSNYERGLELTEKEKSGLTNNEAILISFVEDGNLHEFVASIGMLDAADINWREGKYRVFGVGVVDVTATRLIGVTDPEPPQNTKWRDIHGGIWHHNGQGWLTEGLDSGAWPYDMEHIFPMERVTK